MKDQKEANRYLKKEWDRIIETILNEPFLLERNQQLVHYYEDLQEGFENDGIDISEARSYQHTGQ